MKSAFGVEHQISKAFDPERSRKRRAPYEEAGLAGASAGMGGTAVGLAGGKIYGQARGQKKSWQAKTQAHRDNLSNQVVTAENQYRAARNAYKIERKRHPARLESQKEKKKLQADLSWEKAQYRSLLEDRKILVETGASAREIGTVKGKITRNRRKQDQIKARAWQSPIDAATKVAQDTKNKSSRIHGMRNQYIDSYHRVGNARRALDAYNPTFKLNRRAALAAGKSKVAAGLAAGSVVAGAAAYGVNRQRKKPGFQSYKGFWNS